MYKAWGNRSASLEMHGWGVQDSGSAFPSSLPLPALKDGSYSSLSLGDPLSSGRSPWQRLVNTKVTPHLYVIVSIKGGTQVYILGQMSFLDWTSSD